MSNVNNSDIHDSQINSAAITSDKMYSFVFAPVEEEMSGDSFYLASVIIEFLRSAVEQVLYVNLCLITGYRSYNKWRNACHWTYTQEVLDIVLGLKHEVGLAVEWSVDEQYRLEEGLAKYTWVLFLHSKDETPDMIIDHINKIELEARVRVRIIRSNNGTKFRNAKLNDFCVEKGISRQFSAPRTPQENGVVERKN
ncbi:hypothetical protein AgCh_025091 [Apium graveolens]